MRLPIHQALAFCAFHGSNGAVNVAAAERNAVIVAEVKFREITMKMLFLTVLVNALHSALENRERAFNRIGVNVASHIFACEWRHRLMRGKIRYGVAIEAAFVGVQRGLRGRCCPLIAFTVSSPSRRMEGADIAAALDKRHDRALARRAGATALRELAALACFVGLRSST